MLWCPSEACGHQTAVQGSRRVTTKAPRTASAAKRSGGPGWATSSAARSGPWEEAPVLGKPLSLHETAH